MAEPLHRRTLLKSLAALGAGTAAFRRALAARAADAGKISGEMIAEAEWIAGLTLTDEERASTAANLERSLASREAIRRFPVDYSIAPALHFHPAPAQSPNRNQRAGRVELPAADAPRLPDNDKDIAFLPVAQLAALLRTKQLTSLALTKLYLQRLKLYDPLLKCVVALTEELALGQAAQADREIAAGRYRGPLHGIPWGAKDLIAYPGYKTTWGAGPFREQTLATKATVAQRLDDAGAVLVAKLSLGALAWGDEWFGGQTRNPWNTREGSSGSSAGSACAAAAGLVGFALGSETLGSIVSPSLRCGASGLRPTFGRVSRYGCMSLAWSMDKIGPICRTVEDCAIVLGAIHGRDGLDPTTVDYPFAWPATRDVRTLRAGYFDNGMPIDERPDLTVLRELGVTLVRVQLPENIPADALTLILNVESAAVFSPLVRQGNLEGTGHWPNELREGQFITAVDYLQAQRLRTLLMREMEKLFDAVDCTIGGDDLTITNLTGHPCVALPCGFEMRDGREVPVGLTFTGRLYGDETLLALAHAYQTATAVHQRRPPLV